MPARAGTEIRASSKKGFDDAVRVAIERACQSLELVSSAQVTKQGVIVRADQVAEYWVVMTVKADAIVSVDEAQNIVEFNRAAESIFGYSRDEVLGRSLETLIPERYRPDHGSHVRAFGNSGTVEKMMGQRDRVWGLRKDGTEFPVAASIAKQSERGARRYRVLLRDLTES
jgi:PAS domain S-box-containing protein